MSRLEGDEAIPEFVRHTPRVTQVSGRMQTVKTTSPRCENDNNMKRRQPTIEIIPAKASHVRPIARRMREADRIEVWAQARKTPGEALVYSLRKSAFAWTAIVNGQPEVMFGVGDVNVLTGAGSPWLLGTDAVEKHYVAFLRLSVDFRAQLLERYSVLTNIVHDGNRASIRWLRWLGFKLSDPVSFDGHMFRVFELRR